MATKKTSKEELQNKIKNHIDLGSAIIRGQEATGVFQEPVMSAKRLSCLWTAYQGWREKYDEIADELHAMGESTNFPQKTADAEKAYIYTFQGAYDICREIRNVLQEHIKELSQWQANNFE